MFSHFLSSLGWLSRIYPCQSRHTSVLFQLLLLHVHTAHFSPPQYNCRLLLSPGTSGDESWIRRALGHDGRFHHSVWFPVCRNMLHMMSFLWTRPQRDARRALGTSLYTPWCSSESALGEWTVSDGGVCRLAQRQLLTSRAVFFPCF